MVKSIEFFAFALVFLVFGVGPYFLAPRLEMNAGDFGDMFGAASSLFSFLAFVVIWLTLKHQKAQIAEQAEIQERIVRSLSEQAQEMKRTARLNALAYATQTSATFSEGPGRGFSNIQISGKDCSPSQFRNTAYEALLRECQNVTGIDFKGLD